MCAIDFGELLDLSWNTSWYFCYALSPGQTIATCQRNISQHCWVRLATVLRHVVACWMLLAQIWPFSNLSQQHPTYRNTLQHGGQTHVTCCAQQCCDMLRWHVAIVWPGLNANEWCGGKSKPYNVGCPWFYRHFLQITTCTKHTLRPTKRNVLNVNTI